jgi:hypothetical protein
MEIGCDYGITVDKIRKSMEEAGDVPLVWKNDDSEEGGNGEDKVQNTELNEVEERVPCLGVDRSVESIDIANER